MAGWESLLESETGFHPEMTGRENIYLSGSILGMRAKEIRRQFDEIVAFAEVDKFHRHPGQTLSSGMYLRLAFAVAAHLEPEILLVDEVLAVGDAAFQKKCLGKMSALNQQPSNGRVRQPQHGRREPDLQQGNPYREGSRQTSSPVSDDCRVTTAISRQLRRRETVCREA